MAQSSDPYENKLDPEETQIAMVNERRLLAFITALENNLSPYDAVGAGDMTTRDLLYYAAYVTGRYHRLLKMVVGDNLENYLREVGLLAAEGP